MKIIFLDYDGVVNTLWIEDIKNGEPNFNYPNMDRVNNTQAIGWLNWLYRKFPYKIVVSSTWRLYPNYKECLYKAGLNEEIEILGITTPHITGFPRGQEIETWLEEHMQYDVEDFIILDDDADMEPYMDHLYQTDSMIGITPQIMFKIEDRWKGVVNLDEEIYG